MFLYINWVFEIYAKSLLKALEHKTIVVQIDQYSCVGNALSRANIFLFRRFVIKLTKTTELLHLSFNFVNVSFALLDQFSKKRQCCQNEKQFLHHKQNKKKN